STPPAPRPTRPRTAASPPAAGRCSQRLSPRQRSVRLRAMGGKGDRPAGLENRWWVDQQKDAQGHLVDAPRVPLRFFRSGLGFEQDRAQRRLTDLNLKWFGEADAPPGGWAIIHTLPNQRVPEPRVSKVRAALPVPSDGRGILVDSGEALRAIITGSPIGERLVEVRLRGGARVRRLGVR